MNKLKGIRTLLYDTYSKCFAFLHPDKNTKDYQKVETTQEKENEHEYEDVHEEGTEWSTQETIYQTQNSEERIEKKKKPVLIGNIEEDAGVHKDDAHPDLDEDLFDDAEKPSFNQKITVSSKTSKKPVNSFAKAKNENAIAQTTKFAMDENLEVERGWGDVDDNLEI